MAMSVVRFYEEPVNLRFPHLRNGIFTYFIVPDLQHLQPLWLFFLILMAFIWFQIARQYAFGRQRREINEKEEEDDYNEDYYMGGECGDEDSDDEESDASDEANEEESSYIQEGQEKMVEIMGNIELNNSR